jgi:hypothetical protein
MADYQRVFLIVASIDGTRARTTAEADTPNERA